MGYMSGRGEVCHTSLQVAMYPHYKAHFVVAYRLKSLLRAKTQLAPPCRTATASASSFSWRFANKAMWYMSIFPVLLKGAPAAPIH